MEDIQDKLFIYCRSVDLNDCISILKNKIRKENQIQEYDRIYNEFIKTHTLEEYDQNTIIECLNVKIKLMIFCQIYRHLLLPHLFQSETNISDKKIEWILSLFEKQYSIFSFIFVSRQLCCLYDNDVFGGEISKVNEMFLIYNEKLVELRVNGSPCVTQFDDIDYLPTNRFCFPYVLLHKAGNLSYDSVISLLVEDPIMTKIPLSFKFTITLGEGPHGGEYNNCGQFFEHDMEHMHTIMDNISYFNYDDINNRLKDLVKGSLNWKIHALYVFMYIFEIDSHPEMSRNMFDEFETHFRRIIYNGDSQDYHYIFEYLMNSSEINNEEYIVEYMEFKVKSDYYLKENRRIHLNKVERDDHYIQEWSENIDKLEELCHNYFDNLCNIFFSK